VLLADEPTGNLDSENAEDVLELLGRLHRRGATIVMVTHSDEVAEHASRIVKLADGRVVADERLREPLAVGAAV
jgi:ABC-type lipoprotein export system ATPase subunit